MHESELLILVLLVVLPGISVVARQIDVPFPILLVVAGLILGVLPGLPDPELDPDLVLVLFLPPLLYQAAFFADLRDMRANIRPLTLLAVVLVIVTASVVAVVAHELLDMPWAAAFALGGILAPTDPIAATAIMRRLGVSRQTVNVLEGESLLNDGTALVVYRAGVAAAIGGTFSLAEASLEFFGGIIGGIAIGLAVGWLIGRIRSRIDDIPTEITISLFTGYAAYLPAEQLGVSGVLAAVTAGIVLGWMAPRIASAQMRLQGYATWEIVVFLLNGVLFVLIGLQLPHVIDGIEGQSTADLIGYALAFFAVVVITRWLWVNISIVLIRLIDRRPSQLARRTTWRDRVITSWSGMRGAVSLAAALAVPFETDAGQPFPQRDLIVFITFSVVVLTVVVQGLTLPWLVRVLGVHEDGAAEEREELRARLIAAKAALAELDALEEEGSIREDTLERMRGLYRYRKRRFAARAGKAEDDGFEDRSLVYQQAVRRVLDAQREAIVGLRNSGDISSDVMRRVERELDLEDTRLEI
jgi:CPA1 family monovalent cation:H+ antiporter